MENPTTGKQYERNIAHLKKVVGSTVPTVSPEQNPEPRPSLNNETSLGSEEEFMGFNDEESEDIIAAL